MRLQVMESRLQLDIIVDYDLGKEEEGGRGARLAHGLSPPIFPSPDELPFQPQTWRECKQGIHGPWLPSAG